MRLVEKAMLAKELDDTEGGLLCLILLLATGKSRLYTIVYRLWHVRKLPVTWFLGTRYPPLPRAPTTGLSQLQYTGKS